MTNTEKLALMKNRLVVLEGNGKNIKSPGVVRKLQRQIRNIENRQNKPIKLGSEVMAPVLLPYFACVAYEVGAPD